MIGFTSPSVFTFVYDKVKDSNFRNVPHEVEQSDGMLYVHDLRFARHRSH